MTPLIPADSTLLHVSFDCFKIKASQHHSIKITLVILFIDACIGKELLRTSVFTP